MGIVATEHVGNASNSDWVDVAVGDFDGDGNREIALLKNAHSNLFLIRFAPPGSFQVLTTDDLDSDPSLPWKAVAAGDLDSDGVDELVAAREGDGTNTTVTAYKMSPSGFTILADTTFGSNGNSNWRSATIGDFNNDGRSAIVMVKNEHSNFVMLEYDGTSILSVTATHDLDSASGQEWRGLTAIDWHSGADLGAQELVAVRAAQSPYRVDLFVYGDDFLRAERDSAVANVDAQAYHERGTEPGQGQFTCDGMSANYYNEWDVKDIIQKLVASHTNTYQWQLRDPDDYLGLVTFLAATKDLCINGQQLRVWATLFPFYVDAPPPCGVCSLPTSTDGVLIDGVDPTPGWDESEFIAVSTFAATLAGAPEHPESCSDYAGWASLLGRLAVEYPHLVGIGFDDFSHAYLATSTNIVPVAEEDVARMQTNARVFAPWLNFMPTTYHEATAVPDFGRGLDSFVFYFRDDGAGLCTCDGCMEQPCAVESIGRAPQEFCDMRSLLPMGRNLHHGIYFTGHSTRGTPSAFYDYKLSRMPRDNRWMGINGTTVYQLQEWPIGGCNSPQDYLDDNKKFCTVQKLFSGEPAEGYVGELDLSAASCLSPEPATGSPAAYAVASESLHNVAYRGSDGTVRELWRTETAIGQTDLSGAANAPPVQGGTSPTAFYVDTDASHNITYAGTDAALHWMSWTNANQPVDHNLSGASGLHPVGTPFGFFLPNLGVREVLYRATTGPLFLDRFETFPNVTHSNVSSGSPNPTGNPFGYAVALRESHAVYRGSNAHVFLIQLFDGSPLPAVDLTQLAGAPDAVGSPVAYLFNGVHTTVYRGIDNNLHALSWTALSNVTLTTLTGAPGAPSASGDPFAYVTPDGINHAIYRSSNGHMNEVWWLTGGAVTHVDLSEATQATSFPRNDSRPFAYHAFDGTQRVVFLRSDGHVVELRWD
jgi:hypothetical protein